MNLKALKAPVALPKVPVELWMLIFGLLVPMALSAQVVATLSGVATDASGKPVANAVVSIRAGSGAPVEVHTDATGKYVLPNLTPGDYTISATAQGLSSKSIQVTITDVPQQTLDLLLNFAPAQQGTPPAPSPGAPGLPNAPSAAPPSTAPASPSLEDLGFSAQQTQANTKLQAMLEKRTRMLKIHQRLGLITAIPMAAAVITGPMAKAKGKNGQTIKEPTTANLDFHAALGGVTTALYFTTAYYAIWAPRVPGTPKHGAIRVHEALAFIHGPGMILTPVLGYMAYKQENAGEKVHGIAGAHGVVAYTTAISYGAAIVAISWPIHWKFWEK
jgi:hypothetical protein